MFGLLNVNKPAGMTSRDVVNQVQRLVRPAKVGHAGTLDPLATGVLVMCLGAATRLIPYVQKMEKRYRGVFIFGCSSDTEDVEGNVIEEANAKIPSRDELLSALPHFVGTISQKPPAYSALRVKGKRAYELARQGKAPDLAPREVHIHDLQLVDFNPPRFTLDICCGSGTYIRSLGRDIAILCETTAIMSSLVRTAIGEFSQRDALALDELDTEKIEAAMLPALEAIPNLTKVRLDPDQQATIARGQFLNDEIVTGQCDHPISAADELSALDAQGNLVAILVRRGPQWGASRNFSQ